MLPAVIAVGKRINGLQSVFQSHGSVVFHDSVHGHPHCLHELQFFGSHLRSQQTRRQ